MAILFLLIQVGAVLERPVLLLVAGRTPTIRSRHTTVRGARQYGKRESVLPVVVSFSLSPHTISTALTESARRKD